MRPVGAEPTLPVRWALGRVRRVQNGFGNLIRSRVAGPDADERAERIWGQPGPRWFTADDPVWRVHADASMFVGGITALLLQALHPAAMAGVAGHSGYKSDPWGRLQRTSTYIAVTTYGLIPDAEAAVAKVRDVHERVRGKDHRGRPYRASDPRLLLWVHVAEISSFLNAYRAYGASPISDADADTYVEQAGHAASLLGAEGVPTTVAELDAVLASFRPELEVSPAAIETARFVVAEPPLPGVARPGYALLVAGAIALLEPWQREALQIGVPETLTRTIGRPLGRFAAAAVRWGLEGVDDTRRRSAPPGHLN